MPRASNNKRVLIYSHDSFGLGHLRRCRKIAHSIVARRKAASVLILSGSPIIGSFDFRTRVDFVRIPGVIKLRSGEYSSLSLHMDIAEVLELRAAIIRHTAEAFAPDLLIVDLCLPDGSGVTIAREAAARTPLPARRPRGGRS